MVYFTELEKLPFHDVRGEHVGRLVDLAIDPTRSATRVAHYPVKTPAKEILCVRHDQISTVSVRNIRACAPAEKIHSSLLDEGSIRIKRDVLDKQIIDMKNRKVVRAIDADFEIQHNANSEVNVLAVNIGADAAVRRLSEGLLAKHRIRQITSIL